MNESRMVLLSMVKLLRMKKYPKGHYHPSFLESMEHNIVYGKEIGSNALLLIERSFWKHYPGGL